MKQWMRAKMEHAGLYAAALGKWIALGGLIGIFGGLVGSLFHIGVQRATMIRDTHSWILYLLPLGGLFIVWLYRVTKTEGKGTNDIIESVHFGSEVPLLLVPVIFAATIVTHLFGGSAGREGAALQIGGGIGYHVGGFFHLDDKDLRIATLCGMSGVFSALFGTPLTATVFALEVISVGVLYYVGLIPCMALPLILGENIGTCATAFLVSLRGGMAAKQTALIHLLFNCMGTAGVVLLLMLFEKPAALLLKRAADFESIAVIHSVFNLLSAALLLPFSDGLAKIAERLTGAGREKVRL